MSECYLCGKKLIRKVNWTKDHIPPDCFFPPGTQSMIIVPCCYPCNQEYEPLDEKIRNHIASLIKIPSKPIEKGHRAVMQSLKLKKEYLSYTKEHPTLKRKNGKPRLIYHFNKLELDKWLIRIVKGLYFYKNQKRIVENAIFRPEVIYDIIPPSAESFPMEKGLERRPYFIYGVEKVQISPEIYFWGFIFYDKLLFTVEVEIINS